jgi:predicted amidohydrolase YtcJ
MILLFLLFLLLYKKVRKVLEKYLDDFLMRCDTAATSHHKFSRTGVFVDNAMDLIDKPALSEAETRECFETTMRDALRVGLTSIQDAASFPKDIAFFQRHVLLNNCP